MADDLSRPEGGHDRTPSLRGDLCPSIEGCCDDACCYLDWLIGRGGDGQ
jgi:hypothetical protein